MKRISVVGIAIIGLGLGNASAARIECPKSISSEQKIVSTPDGWESASDKEPHYFDRVGLFLGHPSERGELVPDDPHVPKKSIWTLMPNDKFGVWVGCHYHNTSIVLAKPVDKKAKECVATYKVNPGDNNHYFQYMECK